VDTSVEICSNPQKCKQILQRQERGKINQGSGVSLLKSPFGRRLEKKSKMERLEQKRENGMESLFGVHVHKTSISVLKPYALYTLNIVYYIGKRNI
jgi:hypothetical protein